MSALLEMMNAELIVLNSKRSAMRSDVTFVKAPAPGRLRKSLSVVMSETDFSTAQDRCPSLAYSAWVRTSSTKSAERTSSQGAPVASPSTRAGHILAPGANTSCRTRPRG